MNITEKIKRAIFNLTYNSLPNQYSMCEENNILGIYNEDYLVTKTENFIGAIELQGFNYNAATEQRLIDLSIDRINSLNALNDAMEARIIVRRRELTYNREYEIDNIYAEKLINQWENNQRVFINSYMIIFETKNTGAKGFLRRKSLNWQPQSKKRGQTTSPL